MQITEIKETSLDTTDDEPPKSVHIEHASSPPPSDEIVCERGCRVIEHTPRVSERQLRELSQHAAGLPHDEEMCLHMEYGHEDDRMHYTFVAKPESPYVIEIKETGQFILMDERLTPSGGRYVCARCPSCHMFRSQLFVNRSGTHFFCRVCSGDLLYRRQLWSRNKTMMAYWQLERARKELDALNVQCAAPMSRFSPKREARRRELTHRIAQLEIIIDARQATAILRSYSERSRTTRYTGHGND